MLEMPDSVTEPQVTEIGPAPVVEPLDEMGHVVYEALGAASSCWSNLEGAGVFQSEKCSEIGDNLMAYLKEQVTSAEKQQELRVLTLQVAANRCENVADLIKYAAECEAYLINGAVPQGE